MTTAADTSAAPAATPADTAAAPSLRPEEVAALEAAKTGITEPVGVNELKDTSGRPEGVPEKFWKDGKLDTEGLLASYTALEKKQSAPAPAAEEPAAEATADAAAANANGKIEKPKAAEPAAEANPLSDLLTAARTDFESTQSFSEETAQKLVDAGIPAEIQQVYLAGLAALTTQNLTTIHGFVDGEDNYNAMAKWAGEKLTDEELEAYNAALDSPALRENAVRGLYARFTAARPSEGNLITPSGTPSASGDVYSSRDDFIADQRDARYQTDSKFRQEVIDKLARSQAAGFQLVKRPQFAREVLTR